jgi:hypothetical protein
MEGQDSMTYRSSIRRFCLSCTALAGLSAPALAQYASSPYGATTPTSAPQSGAPAAATRTSIHSQLSAEGQGNPYWRQGRPRATLLGGPMNTPVAAYAAPSTTAPLPAAMPTLPLPPSTEMVAAAPVPSTIAPPNPVLPNYGAPQSTETPAPGPATPASGPALVAALPPVTTEVAQPPAAELHGVDILRQPFSDTAQGLRTVMAWGQDALVQMQGLRDYTCTFKKREAVDGKLGDQQTMFVKSRVQPLAVYMYFLDQDVRGQEAIYVEGRNNGNIIAHPVGFKQTLVGTLSLAPTDPQAMEGNRYPITNFGLVNLTRRYLQGIENDLRFNECEVRIIEGARVNDRACTCIQVTHPTQRREFPYSMTRLYVDNEMNVPIRCEGYEFPRRAGDAPPLVEEYTYSNLKLNVGLSDADFDPRNPQYGYK